MHPFPAYAQTRPQPMAVYFKIRVDRLLADLCIVRARRQVMRNRVPDLWRHPATDHELSSSSTLVSRCSTIQANLCMYIYIYIYIYIDTTIVGIAGVYPSNLEPACSDAAHHPVKCEWVCFVRLGAAPSTYGPPAAQDILRSRGPPQAL